MLVDAMAPGRLFGPFFGGPEWRPWRVVAAALAGQRLEGEDLDLYRACTGREASPTMPAREAWLVCGRRGGKSRFGAAAAVALACLRDYRPLLAPGETGTLPIIAADRKQARTVMSYITGLVDNVPLLSRLVEHRTAESITFATRCRIEVHTASFRSVRGYTVIGAVLDEVAFWRSEDSANPDIEVLTALRPAMATVPGALLLAISSPYARRGVLWEAFRRHHGPQGAADVLVWRAPTRTMNVTVSERMVAEALEADEAAARAEYLGEFRSDVDAFVAPEAVDAAIVPGRYELPRMQEHTYMAFVDPSGGSQDAMTVAIAHAEHRAEEYVAVLDAVREVKPPFSPESVVADFAGLLKSYGISTVTGDRYAGEWPRERFQVHGIGYEASERTKAEIYRDALPALNSGRVELLDLPRLRSQLIGLERRTARGGRDSVDHAPGAHDDLANAAAGALVLAAAAPADGIVAAVGLREDSRPAHSIVAEMRREFGMI